MLNKFKTFNVKPSWAYGKQKAVVISEIKDIQDSIFIFAGFLYNCNSCELWFIKDNLKELEYKMNKLEKKKDYLNKLIREHRAFENGITSTPPQTNDFNLEEIKRIPLDKIIKIESNGFFTNNPFRTEHSPSNSLHWNKKTNRWCDYGSSKFGDVIDLYMKIKTCDFITACRELQGLV